MAKKSSMQCLADEDVDTMREKVMRSFQEKMGRIIEKYSITSTDDYETCESTVLIDIDTGKFVYEDGDSIEVECSNGTINKTALSEEEKYFLDSPGHEMQMKCVSACDSFAKAFFIAISPIKNIEKETHPRDFQKLIEPPTKKRCHRQLDMNDTNGPLANDVNPGTDLKHSVDCHVKISRVDDKHMKCTVPNGLATEKMCQRLSESPRKERRKTMERDKAPVRRKGARHCPKDGLMEHTKVVNDKKNNHSLPEVHYNGSDDDKQPSNCRSAEEKMSDDLEEDIVLLTCKSNPHMKVFPEWFKSC